jgi:UPF0755 protein
LLRLMIQSLKVAAIIVLTLAIIFISQRALFHYLNSASASSGEPVTFVVADSETVNSVASRLQQAGLIRSGTYFKLKMRLSNADSKLKAGRFTLREGMSVDQIITALTTSDNVQVVNIRFQEGWRTEQYAEQLVQAGLIQTTDQFTQAIQNGDWNFDFLASRPNTKSLDGFLFPDTYQFRADATPDDVINTMLQNFEQRVSTSDQAKAQDLGLNLFQVMTVASIVEREAVLPEERPIIASVYYNRMKQNMPLQADPTVQYAVGKSGDWWPQISPSDLTVQSPYNTYQSPGLPPGPICNPSLASIEAALSPAQTDYLYFVAKSDGSGAHVFAKTYDEQLQNIQKYGGGTNP